MGLFETKTRSLRLPISLKVGYFGCIDRIFILPTEPLAAKTEIELETLPVSCMFKVYKVLVDQRPVGYGFSSAFKTSNHGGYLLTRTERFIKPDSFSVVLRLQDLVLCDFANAGALAISPKISPAVSNIFLEQ